MTRMQAAPIGQRFGKLVVLREVTPDRARSGRIVRKIEAICDCGSTGTFLLSNIAYGRTLSCGCNRGGPSTHGMSKTPTWFSWMAMVQRCTDEKCRNYRRYGARGIKVCERWLDFQNFFTDMGVRPPGTSLDRFPNGSGNYEPGNCRWATFKQQARNQKANRLLTIGDLTLPLAEWAEKAGINVSTLRTRLRDGWTVEKAVKTPTIRYGAAEMRN